MKNPLRYVFALLALLAMIGTLPGCAINTTQESAMEWMQRQPASTDDP